MNIELQLKSWASGIDFERNFWRNWIQTNGSRWPDGFAAKTNPDTPLNPDIAAIIRGKAGAKVCDVGSGPAPGIGYKLDGHRVDITAVDPLAPIYSMLWDEAKMVPPIKPSFAPAEELAFYLEPNSFDVVHCRNALDHSFDPMRGLEHMLRITKVGGTVMLRHHRNEAVEAKYKGFHHFNFDGEDGKFVIWNESFREFPEDVFADYCTANTKLDKDWISTTFLKTSDLPELDIRESMSRVAQYFEAFVVLMASVQLPEQS